MKFRYARHTNQLDVLKEFYQELLFMDILGSFEDHDNYNGVFLGKEGLDWEIEFTQSEEEANHVSDADDLLVFYLSQDNFRSTYQQLLARSITLIDPKNPYWKQMGITFADPDGFLIVIALEERIPVEAILNSNR
jgi:hypothetical protein